MPPAELRLRLRHATPELLSLPWRRPLEEWGEDDATFRPVPVGPSRHLVRFVEADRRLWALKAMPQRTATHEYEVLRTLEERDLPAVRPAGVVEQPAEDAAVLVTHFLERSWQYRRLFLRVATSEVAQRNRLLDAMAVLLVDLHRNGIYWGDCSLANTLFRRDGQAIQAWMVDGETAEAHRQLSDGQRQLDLEVMVENIAGGLLDVAVRRGDPPEDQVLVIDEAHGVVDRYEQLWRLLHHEPIVDLDDRHEVEGRLRQLNEAGFAVDEIALEPAGLDDRLRLKVAVAGRHFHADRLRGLTGMEVSEGQATILMNDLQAHRTHMERELGRPVDEDVAARDWLYEVLGRRIEPAFRALGEHGDPVQAYCDLLEVRWLLSEAAGADVGDEPALEVLAQRAAPGSSAAGISFVELPTEEVPAIDLDADIDFGIDVGTDGGIDDSAP